VRPYLKNNHRVKRAGGVAQVAKHLLNKHKIWSSNPVLPKKKEKKKHQKVQIPFLGLVTTIHVRGGSLNSNFHKDPCFQCKREFSTNIPNG
jgi:hypothetical protein